MTKHIDLQHDAEQTEVYRPVVVAKLSASQNLPFDHRATEDECARLAMLFEAISVDRFRFSGILMPSGDADWSVKGRVQATIIQECVVTLAPVVSRIDEPMHRRFMPVSQDQDLIDFDPEADDDVNPLGDVIDLGAVAIEVVSLALDPYPRAPDAGLDPQILGDPSDADEGKRKPFAALEALRRKMADKD